MIVRPLEECDSDSNEKEVWDISDFCRNSELVASALDRVKSLCDYHFLSVPTTVAEAQKQIKNGVQVIVEASSLETFFKESGFPFC